MNKFFWEKSPVSPLCISRKECHVWKVDLRTFKVETFKLDVLSEDEQKRLSSFKFLKDRFRYGVTHSLKRWVLANYLTERPEKLVFTREKYGKPAILPQENWLNLQFNISHSNQIILIAVTIEDPIGVDVEYHSDNISVEDLSELIFSPLERSYFSKLSTQQKKKEAFFRCWTSKEAYLKAEGMGLNDFPSNISIDMSEFPTDERLETLAHNKKKNLPWKLFPVDVGKSYTAAVVSTHYPKRLVGYTVDYI